MRELICGIKSVLEAINHNVELVKIYVSKETNLNLPKDVEIEKVTNEFLNKLTSNVNHQGVVAVLKEFNYGDFNQLLVKIPERVLVLDHIQDPQNFGAIIRSANAAGFENIIIPKERAAQISPSTLKVASGGQININVIKVSSIFDAICKLKEKGYWVYSSLIDANAKDYLQVKYQKPIVLVVGNEKNGISKSLIKITDEKIFIPMKGSVQSLNVSVATAVLMFHINRY